MINANELRIGNILEYSGDFFKVKSISQKVVGVDRNKGIVEFKPSDLNPIPLTEEILLKCGFEKIGEDYPIFSMDDGLFEIVLHKRLGFIYPKFWHKEFEYLHQLQNLYFELTRKELNTEGLI